MKTQARFYRAKVFTKPDIRQAFHSIRMHSDSEELTTFRVRYRAKRYGALPFRLTNGLATHQRYMNNILFKYQDVFCFTYLEDIKIYSENMSEYKDYVKLFLDCLRQANLQADVVKCEFRVDETEYLGFVVTTKKIRVDSDQIMVIENWKPQNHSKAVQ